MKKEEIFPAALAEFFGPLALVFAGAGAIILTHGQNIVAIALAHGLAIGLMIMALGHISGGHFNPAVTIAMLATGRIGLNKAIAYIVAQLLGGLVGALLLTVTYPALIDEAAGVTVGRNNVNLGTPGIGGGANPMNALIMEIILTFFLVFVIFGVAVDWRSSKAIAGLCVGLTITMDILAGGVVSGAAMNPARWFGPAVVQGDFSNFWIWIVGPIVGGLIAAFVYQTLFLSGIQEEVEAVAEAVSNRAAAPAKKRRG
ncbi:MAG: MIP/aquaporin family protein [Thermomicrobiales bacterium]